MQKDIANLRLDYKQQTLEIDDVHGNPILQFEKWFEEALSSDLREPNAMTVATVDKDNTPDARIVLLKGFDERGFVFYTNFDSQKGNDIAANPHAALVFNWLELERQVRIKGHVEKVSDDEATAYFQSRPKSSQIGAWASPQSKIIISRDVLVKNQTELEEKYEKDVVLPKPSHWGGYRVVPSRIEFWQGRSSRLHDRIVYKHHAAEWTLCRLAP